MTLGTGNPLYLTMKKLLNKEFAIGASVIVAIVILVFGIDYLKGINLFKPANYYVIAYDNVVGLETAAPVTIQGYKVGQVRDIRFPYDRPGKVEVDVALDKHLHLPEGSVAYLTPSMLSGPSIEIKLGTGSRMIPVGGNLPSAHKGDMLSSVTDELMPKVMEVIPQIDSLLNNLNRLVGDPALLSAIQRLDGITANLEATTAALNAAAGRELPVIMRNASKMTNTLDSTTVNLAALSYKLKALPLDATVENVNDLTANLKHFSNQLNDPNSTLGQLMNDPELYNRLNRVAADVDSLIVDIKKNPKRYISIKLL